MSDEQVVVPNDPGFVPEPVPDNIADTEINGLEPAPTDEQAPVEEVNDDTTDDQPEVDTPAEEPVDEPEQPKEPDTPAEEPQQPDAQELARQRFEQSRQAREQRDYIKEERAKIRDYEQTADTSDVEERMRILESKQYIDTVERNRQNVASDVTRAQSEIAFFKANTPESQLLFNQSLENFANAYGVTDPESGEWIAAQDRNGNDVQLLPYLQQQAAIYEQALATSQRQVQKSETKMRAKAVNPSNTGKATSSGDELQDLLDRIGDSPLN